MIFFLIAIIPNLSAKNYPMATKSQIQKAQQIGLFKSVLAKWDDFRTLEWVSLIKNPEVIIRQAEQLLAGVE